jgi:hypothetical protein
MAVVSHPPYFSPLPRLKIKLEDRPFDTIGVIEAESQAVLNTLAEHHFQDTFKNVRIAGKGAYTLKGTTSRAMVASKPNVSFFTRWHHQSWILWMDLCILLERGVFCDSAFNGDAS